MSKVSAWGKVKEVVKGAGIPNFAASLRVEGLLFNVNGERFRFLSHNSKLSLQARVVRFVQISTLLASCPRWLCSDT